MVLGVWFAIGLSLWLSSCQDGYPIAATECDDWCDATQAMACGNYDPAACVMDCETQGFTHSESCRPAFETALDCFTRFPELAVGQCSYGFGAKVTECQLRYGEVYRCASEQRSE